MTKTTAKKTRKPIDTAEAKRREIRRLERRLAELNGDYRLTLELRDDLREQLREAHELVKAEPDAVGQLIRGAIELCKHFPAATSATLLIYQDHTATCQIPIPLPAKPAYLLDSAKA